MTLANIMELALRQLDEAPEDMETLGIPTRLVQVGPNLKITLPGDLELAELIFNHRAEA